MFVAEVKAQRAPDVDPDAAASGREEEGLGRLIYAVAAVCHFNPRAILKDLGEARRPVDPQGAPLQEVALVEERRGLAPRP